MSTLEISGEQMFNDHLDHIYQCWRQIFNENQSRHVALQSHAAKTSRCERSEAISKFGGCRWDGHLARHSESTGETPVPPISPRNDKPTPRVTECIPRDPLCSKIVVTSLREAPGLTLLSKSESYIIIRCAICLNSMFLHL